MATFALLAALTTAAAVVVTVRRRPRPRAMLTAAVSDVPPLPSGELDEAVDRSGTFSRKMQGRNGAFLGRDVVPLWVADMDFRSPQPIVDALVERAADGVYGYTDCPPELAADFAKRLVERYGCTVPPSPDWFRWTPGLLPMLNHAVRAACTRAGDAVVVPTPVYPPFLDAPINCAASLVRVPLVEERLASVAAGAGGASTLRFVVDWAALERALASPDVRLLHWCNPHNPTGRCWTLAENRRVAELCVRHDVILCSDEVWGDVSLDVDEQPFISMLRLLAPAEAPPAAAAAPTTAAAAGGCDDCAAVPGLLGRLIVLNSPSKCFNVAPLDLAVATIPSPELRAQFRRCGADAAEVSVFGYVAAMAAYGEPECEAWRRRLISYLRANRDVAAAALQRMGIRCVLPEASYLLWMDAVDALPAGTNAEAFFLAAGVGLSGGVAFGGAESTVRLNLGCRREVLQEGLGRMERAVRAAREDGKLPNEA